MDQDYSAWKDFPLPLFVVILTIRLGSWEPSEHVITQPLQIRPALFVLDSEARKILDVPAGFEVELVGARIEPVT